jgi:hypothetical protein
MGDGQLPYAIYFVARCVTVEFPVVFFSELAKELPISGKLVDVGIVPCGVRGGGEGLKEPKLRRATLLCHMLSTCLQWVLTWNCLVVFFPELAHNWIRGGPALANLRMLGSGDGGRG